MICWTQVRLDVGTAQKEQLKGQIELFDPWMNEETVTLVRFLWKATAVTTTFLPRQKVSWWSLGGSNS